jgi:hypothetical protein
LKGQPGVCIDTAGQHCVGENVLIGFCNGASTVKCCPSPGEVGVKSRLDNPWHNSGIPGCEEFNDAFNKDGDCFDPCNSQATGVAGTCFDNLLFDCKGATPLVGACAGGSSRVCCPSLTGTITSLFGSQEGPVAVTAFWSGWDRCTASSGGAFEDAGYCIDTTKYACNGKFAVSDVAGCGAGSASLCCPSGGRPISNSIGGGAPPGTTSTSDLSIGDCDGGGGQCFDDVPHKCTAGNGREVGGLTGFCPFGGVRCSLLHSPSHPLLG